MIQGNGDMDCPLHPLAFWSLAVIDNQIDQCHPQGPPLSSQKRSGPDPPKDTSLQENTLPFLP